MTDSKKRATCRPFFRLWHLQFKAYASQAMHVAPTLSGFLPNTLMRDLNLTSGIRRLATLQIGGSGSLLSRGTLLWLAGLLLCLSWLAPNHETPWLSFHQEVLAALAGIAFCLFAALSGHARSRQVPAAAVGLLVVALIPWIQWGVGMVSYRGDALLASMYLVAAGVIVWVGFVTSRTDRDQIPYALALSMLGSAILSTGTALYQRLHLSQMGAFVLQIGPDDRAAGNLGQANHLATLLMFGLASVAWLNARRKVTAWTAGLAAAFLVLGLALTMSRQPFIGLLILGAWSVRAASLRHVRPAQWLALIALLAWFFVAYAGVDHLASALDAVPTAQNYRLKVGLRPLLWGQFVQGIAMSPWFGYGWLDGAAAQAAAAIQRPGLEFSEYAHSLPIDLLIWNGVPLGLVLIGLLLAWYWRMGCAVQRSGGWFQFSIVTFFLGHSLVEYPYAYTYFLVPVALVAGQLEASRRRSAGLWLPRWCVPGLAAATTLALIVVVADYLPLAAERRDLITWKARIGGDHPLPEQSPVLMMDQLAGSVEWLRADPGPGMTLTQIAAQETLSRRYPTVALLSRTAIVLGLNGRSRIGYTELLRLRGLHGERFYAMAVDQIRGLATTNQPQLRELVLMIDGNASSLSPLPMFSEEITGRRAQ